jgi:hypothetical protein
LYNNCFNNESFLNIWKKAEVVIIRKSKDRDPRQPRSYRPISLLPVAAKIYERIILNRLMEKYIEADLES